MKTTQLNFFGPYPNPRPANPNGRPGKSQQEIPDDDDDALFEESELPETFDDDDDLEEFDVAGEFLSSTMQEVYEYMKAS